MNFALILFVLLAITGRSHLADAVYFASTGGRTTRNLVDRISEELLSVILIVFLLRSFLVEPFKIPSGSMVPDPGVGDFILSTSSPTESGFRSSTRRSSVSGNPSVATCGVSFPEDPSLDYIKRVIGVPGDRIVYENKKLSINGVAQPRKQVLRLSESRTDPLLGAVHRDGGRSGARHSPGGRCTGGGPLHAAVPVSRKIAITIAKAWPVPCLPGTIS